MMKASNQGRFPVLASLLCAMIAILLSIGFASPGDTAAAQGEQPPSPYVRVATVPLADGRSLTDTTISGPPRPPAGTEALRQTADVLPAAATMLSAPAYSWELGCSAVSGAMIAGYYDNNGYPNMYTGPTSGGVVPLVEAPSWGTWTDTHGDSYPNNPLIASHNGVDGRASRGTIDDYWVQYNASTQDPYLTHGWTQHPWSSAIGDFMKTSQSARGNPDGSTQFYTLSGSGAKLTCSDMESYGVADVDGTYGRKQFYAARGYTVTDCYNQSTDNNIAGGFSFANFKAEIDARRPTMLNLAGHTVVGVGYDAATNTVYIHDTWDSQNHSMAWGGSYSGMRLLSVSVVNLAPSGPTPPTPQAPVGTILSTTPTYTWSQVPGATQYRYELKQGTTVVYTQTTGTSSCNGTTCSHTPASALGYGEYQWRVQADIGSTWTNYSLPMAFTVASSPEATAPTGVTSDTTPTYTWRPVAGATQYRYKLLKGTTPVYTKLVGAAACTATSCTNTPTDHLAYAAYKWAVQAKVGGTWSAYSAYRPFTITNVPTAKTPTGTVADTTPRYLWSRISGATQYSYSVYKSGVLKYTKTVPSGSCGSSALNCGNTPTTGLAPGSYTWKVKALVGGGWSTYSAVKAFTLGSASLMAGFWQSTTGDEFYVTPALTNVQQFTIYVLACGSEWKISNNNSVPISNRQFAFTGSFYGSGTFATATSESGQDGLDSYYLPGCGNVSGAWSYTTVWKNSTQPTSAANAMVNLGENLGMPNPGLPDLFHVVERVVK